MLRRQRQLPIRRSAITGAVVDELLDRYVDWREEAASAQCAYADWRDAEWHDRRGAFMGYATAIEREDRASRAYKAAATPVPQRAGAVPPRRLPTEASPGAGAGALSALTDSVPVPKIAARTRVRARCSRTR